MNMEQSSFYLVKYNVVVPGQYRPFRLCRNYGAHRLGPDKVLDQLEAMTVVLYVAESWFKLAYPLQSASFDFEIITHHMPEGSLELLTQNRISTLTKTQALVPTLPVCPQGISMLPRDPGCLPSLLPSALCFLHLFVDC